MKPCMRHQINFNHQVTRRDFLKGLGLTTAGLALAACQPAVSGPGATNVASPLVAIQKAQNYDRKLIRTQIEKMFDDIGGIADVLRHGNRVAVKTNLTGGLATKPLPGTTEIETYLTHPEIVRATVELLRDAGAKDIFIVEAVYEKESWPYYGYTEVAKATGATLVDLNYPEPFKDFTETSPGTDPFIYEKFLFNPILNEVDAFVSVSKMKCHNSLGVTHTLKNQVGLIPYRSYRLRTSDTYRSELHGSADEMRTRLPRVVMDLNHARPINLGIIDGIWTTDAGEGPWITAMTPIKPNLLFAGKDPVATDAVATAAMGFDPTAEYPDEPFVNGENHLNLAARLGMGTNKLDDIKVVGEKVADVTVKFTTSF